MTLDCGPNIDRIINFEGPYLLDYSVTKPKELDWNDDAVLDAGLHLPLRLTEMSDRTSRSVPQPYKDYVDPTRFAGARALHTAMLSLQTSDVLSDEAGVGLSSDYGGPLGNPVHKNS